jgi:hypothetical protein
MASRARLPAAAVDLDRVEAACRAVAGARGLTIQLRSRAGAITCWFEITGRELRARELRAGADERELDRRWRAVGYDGGGRVGVEIVLDGGDGTATIAFDAERGANVLAPHLGEELFAALRAELSAS